jgi:hypothetical protein
MLQQMRKVWNAFNTERRARLEAEVQEAQSHQKEVTEYWNHHKKIVVERWGRRTGGRGKTTVADIPEVAAQWHPDNPPANSVSATAQRRGDTSPYLWQCPLELAHVPWSAWPKDRVQSGAGCPSCRKLIKLSGIPTLAEQYEGSIPAEEITYRVHDRVPWICRTWALDPETGQWERVEHRFEAVVKSRSQQGDACLVCAGYVVDETNSLATWFPELARQLDEPELDPRSLSASKHNASRKDLQGDGGDAYAKLHWRCKHGHRWESTVLNRVQGGDCPDCDTSGISKEQVRLVAELAWLMELVPPGRPDSRLPEGTPDFASHKIVIPPRFKPAHWRYREVEVDARFLLPLCGVVLGLEYDGVFHHSPKLRERGTYEAEKSEVLHATGEVDLVVHVRVGPLPPLQASYALAVSVPERATTYEKACAVGTAIEAKYPGSLPKFAEYLAGGRNRGQSQADSFIVTVWGQLKPPRPKPQRVEAPRLRKLKATDPHPSSLLVPVGDPYRNPKKPTEIIRDYECSCSDHNRVTYVQSQVKSGNTRSCGCLTKKFKQRDRIADTVTPEEATAALSWASRIGIAMQENERLFNRVVASYRLDQAHHLEVLGANGLLEDKHVREWAYANNRMLAARGRVPDGLWLDFAADYLSLHG